MRAYRSAAESNEHSTRRARLSGDKVALALVHTDHPARWEVRNRAYRSSAYTGCGVRLDQAVRTSPVDCRASTVAVVVHQHDTLEGHLTVDESACSAAPPAHTPRPRSRRFAPNARKMLPTQCSTAGTRVYNADEQDLVTPLPVGSRNTCRMESRDTALCGGPLSSFQETESGPSEQVATHALERGEGENGVEPAPDEQVVDPLSPHSQLPERPVRECLARQRQLVDEAHRGHVRLMSCPVF